MVSPESFLDVHELLEASVPRSRTNWFWYVMGAFALVLLTSSWAATRTPQLQAVVRLIGAMVMIGVVVGTLMITASFVRRQRAEQQQIEAVEELVQLRRWDHAAGMLDQLLHRPAQSPAARIQALIYLATVLGRYHRYADAITVHDYLLEHVEFDAGTARAIKLMRAMAMLHEDRLFDVDGAISDLRRESPDSAGLALVEMYRDVKTGHPAEAVDIFSSHLAEMRGQLGHRLADAYALAARAHDLMGQEDQAAVAFERATLLCPVEELARKYSEFAAIKDKYRAAAMPGQAVGGSPAAGGETPGGEAPKAAETNVSPEGAGTDEPKPQADGNKPEGGTVA